MIPPRRPWWIRLLISLGAGVALGILVAIAVTVFDLYLSGHGHRWLTSPLLNSAGFGVHMSLADLLFLSSVVLGAVLTWRATVRQG